MNEWTAIVSFKDKKCCDYETRVISPSSDQAKVIAVHRAKYEGFNGQVKQTIIKKVV